MKTHKLKTLAMYYRDVVSGKKQFEIRRNDRDFKVGDILVLQECRISNVFTYTGREATADVTYICNYAQEDDYIVMGIKLREATE